MQALRPYQSTAIDQVRESMRAGHRRVVLVMPTGAGKTHTAAAIVARSVAAGKRVLWLAHRTELVDQAIDSLALHGVIAGAISAGSAKPERAFATAFVASVGTIVSRDTLPPADLVVVDECHHFVAKRWRSVLDRYHTAHVIGLTATPERGDGIGLGELFDSIVVGVSVRTLVESGALVHAEIVAPVGDLRAGEISMRPLDAWLTHATGKKTIVFCNCVKAAREYVSEFQDAGVASAFVTGNTPADERKSILASFQEGTIRVLCNVMVLTEGWDCPSVEACILARGVGTTGLYLQMIGRVLRTAPGKTGATILDLSGCTKAHGHPEDDYTYSLEGDGVRPSKAPIEREFASCKVCGSPLPDGAESCPDCGAAHDGIKPPEVVYTPMIAYARKRSESPDQRAETLARWAAVARERGYRKGWVYGKARAVYGSISWAEVERATRA
jgi:DNA repair protein RadD